MSLRIGTRGSELARWQANTVAALLHQRAGVECEIVIIKTTGDRLAEAKLSEIGGKRLFVKEIEDALLAGSIDLAVHSTKDLPVVLPPEASVTWTVTLMLPGVLYACEVLAPVPVVPSPKFQRKVSKSPGSASVEVPGT